MELHKLAHKLFFLFMFFACSVAVFLLVRNSVQASLSTNTISGISSNTISSTTTVSGINSNTISSTTTPIDKTVSDTISTTSSNTPTTVSSNTTSTATPIINETQVVKPVDSITAAETLTNQVLSSSSGSAPIVSIENEKTVQTVTDIQSKTIESPEIKKENDPTASVVGVRTIEVQVEQVKSIPIENRLTPVMTDTISKNETNVLSEPIVVRAAELVAEKNPKIAGNIDQSLVIENVNVIKKSEEQSNLMLSGKSEPGAEILIYIFSTDPIVITVKADDSGNWSYELARHLEDGQHEAYIAISDEAGRIVSKSEPIAFVKTAQAATMIPISQLEANQSPMEKTSAQYILIAISIMLVFLMIALILIGIITHKRNFDETVN